MTLLPVLAFISPIFGLSLDFDAGTLALPLAPQAMLQTAAATDDVAAAPGEDVDPGVPTTETPDGASEPMESAVDLAEPAPEPAAEPAVDPSSVAAQMAHRARIARAHRRLGLATFGALTATVITGTLQYANQYGFFAARADTRCVRGNPFYGADACIGTPLPHLLTSLTAGALYYTTFGLSFRMPDPIGLDQGSSESARQLRQHKRLRWVHLTGMLLQTTMGMFIANPEWMGLNRADDYRTLQALATVHLLTGYATYGVLTYTGARMAF